MRPSCALGSSRPPSSTSESRVRQGPPAGNDFQRRFRALSGDGVALPSSRQRTRIDALDERTAAEWREGEPYRRLGKPVDRRERATIESVRAKRAAKRSSVAARTGSAPLNASRHELRSRPASPRRASWTRQSRRRNWGRRKSSPDSDGWPTASVPAGQESSSAASAPTARRRYMVASHAPISPMS